MSLIFNFIVLNPDKINFHLFSFVWIWGIFIFLFIKAIKNNKKSIYLGDNVFDYYLIMTTIYKIKIMYKKFLLLKENLK